MFWNIDKDGFAQIDSKLSFGLWWCDCAIAAFFVPVDVQPKKKSPKKSILMHQKSWILGRRKETPLSRLLENIRIMMEIQWFRIHLQKLPTINCFLGQVPKNVKEQRKKKKRRALNLDLKVDLLQSFCLIFFFFKNN